MNKFNVNIDDALDILTNKIPLLNEKIKINRNLIKKNIQDKILLKLKKIKFYYSKLLNVIDYENQLHIFLEKKNTKDFDEKLISFMIIESEKLYNQTPRLIQIICLLYYLEGFNNQYGLILEVLSGEGKTLIISFLALYFAILGKKVDILTSSPVLAERDAKNRKKLYIRFGVTCDFCRKDSKNDNEKRLLECYNADIVYGDGLNLIGDILRYEFMGKRGRSKKRSFDCIIIDEIDNICLDNLRNIVELIDNFPGFGFLEFLYLFIYSRLKIEINQLKNNQESLFAKKNKNFLLEKKEYQDKLELDFNEKLKKEAESIIHKVARKTRKFLHENKNRNNFDEDKIIIPENCYGFINDRIEHWSKMAYDAEFNFKNEEHYIIYRDKDQEFDKIKPVDYINTGVTLENSIWSGLHQFLQIKEGLVLTGENINSSFMSYLSYFKEYNLIYGITGTLGSKKSQKAINNIYKINLLKMPPFQKRQFFPFEPKIFPKLKEYKEEIITEIVKFSAIKKRVVLVLFEYIDQANEMEALLKKNKEYLKLEDSKIILYTRSDMDNTFLEKKLRPNTIILSTNLSGRGTDIKIDPEAEKNGGLHVIITFMPYNERIEQQAQGRAARCGQKGSSITIIASKNKYKTLANRREKYEQEQYKFLIKLYSPQLDLSQELFKKFCKKLDDIKFKNKNIPNNFISDLKERWSMFILKNSINSFMNDTIHPIFAGLFFKLYKKMLTNNYNKLIKEIDEKNYNYDNFFYQMKPNLSIEEYNCAIKKSPMFSIGAYYNQAYVYITTKKKNNYSKYQLLAYNNFKIISSICHKFIQQYKKYKELYEQIHKNDYYDKNKAFEEKKPFLRQCEEKIIMMNKLLENVNKNISKINIKYEKHVLNVKNKYSINSFKEISKNTLEYFNNFGIEFLFEIECISK